MKNLFYIILFFVIKTSFGQDYFLKKYPIDNTFLNEMEYDIDSNIVINYGGANHSKLISLDKSGNVNWSHFGLQGKIETCQSGFYNIGGDGIDIYNTNGDTLNRKRYAYDGNNYIRDVAQFDNGDLLLTTEYIPFDFPTAENTRFTIVRLNENLNVLWTKNIGDTSSTQLSSFCAVSGNYSYIVDRATKDLSTMLLDEQGEIVWQKKIDVINNLGFPVTINKVIDIKVHNDNLYLVGYSAPGAESFLVKMSYTGDVLFVKNIGNYLTLNIFLEVFTEGLLIYFNNQNDKRQNHLFHVDFNGNLLSAKYFEFDNPTYLRNILFEDDTTIFADFVEINPLDTMRYLFLAKTHLTKVVNCYEFENTDTIVFSDANYTILPQAFWTEQVLSSPKPLLYYGDGVFPIQDTTLCETYLPPLLPIEGDAVLTIYPNPSNSGFQFQLTNLALEEGELVEVFFYDINGKLLLQTNYNNKTFTIDEENNLANGMYICVIKVREQKFIEKVVSY